MTARGPKQWVRVLVRFSWLAALAPLAAGAADGRSGSRPDDAPIPRILAHAEVAPALKAAAARDGIDLSTCAPFGEPPRIGDAVVLWAGSVDGQRFRQWLIRMSRAAPTPDERRAHAAKERRKYLSWGPVLTFRSETDALDLWIAGPVDAAAPADGAAARVRRVRIFVPREFLRLGLDASARATVTFASRLRQAQAEDPGFRAGHLFALDRAIPPDEIERAKPVAARVGFTPELERAWVGGIVALQAFYELVDDVPELREIVAPALAKPSAWKLAKSVFGTHSRTEFGGGGTSRLDARDVGLLPVATETFGAPVSFAFDKDPIVAGVLVVTAPVAPLDLCAGVLAGVAAHPKDRKRVVELQVISTARGAP